MRAGCWVGAIWHVGRQASGFVRGTFTSSCVNPRDSSVSKAGDFWAACAEWHDPIVLSGPYQSRDGGYLLHFTVTAVRILPHESHKSKEILRIWTR